MYVSIDDVRNTIDVPTSKISDATITQAIQWAEDEVDAYTETTYYPVEDSGTVTSATATTLVDNTKSWTEDEHINYAVYIYSGTGKGQIREITDNDDTSLTVATWDTNPDTTSKYCVTYINKVTETYDGRPVDYLVLDNAPLVQVDSLTINGTSIDTDNIYTYNDSSRIVLSTDASKTSFLPSTNYTKQNVSITYHYGVLPEVKRGSLHIPYTIKRFTLVIAGLKALAFQMGGTFDDLSTFSLPQFSGSIGQAHANLTAVYTKLLAEKKQLKQSVIGRYYYIE
jgi:hypothetical protein